MNPRIRIFGCVLCLGAMLACNAALGQTEKQPPASKPAAKTGEYKSPAADKGAMPSEEDMARMMAMAAPGPFHGQLKPLAGKWTYTTKYRMSAEEPWNESTGKAEYKWILGGRILIHEVKGNPGADDAMMGGPFEGFGLTGYDNMTKKYFNVWSDIMGTGIMVSTGKSDSSGKTFTYTGEYDCPMTGEHKTPKSVLKIVGDDKLVFEMFDKGPDGKEFQNLEVTYSRQK